MKLHASYMLLFLVLFFSGTELLAQNKPTSGIEPLLGLSFTDAERDSLFNDLMGFQSSYYQIHQYKLPNSKPMSLVFDPVPQGFIVNTKQEKQVWNLPDKVELPANREAVAFFPVYKLASLIRQKKITSVELTTIYLNRLKKYSDTLACTITITEKLALEQAAKADAELAKGKYRGPLHGIPYGVKDLFATEGDKTTWGAAPYKDQTINEKSFIVKKLEEAGAVLVAKLTLGSLAMGDIWYGGVTKNPWNLKEGSSGSSAGSASATVAGLVGFSIGTETLGSIVSPSTRCGASGFRPSYGLVSRSGAMALSWSMDKAGPICRSQLDCALVLDAIRGQDDNDRATRAAAFNFNASKPLSKMKIGYLKSAFETNYPNKENDAKALEVLKSLGAELVAVDFPQQIPYESLLIMLFAEGAASFDELTRLNIDDQLTDQRRNAWPNYFRAARFIPAVEYINASRIRWDAIQQMHAATKGFDAIVAPSFGGRQLYITNLTGQPCAVVPNGFNKDGSPTSISFIGPIFSDATVAQVAWAYQQATDWEDKQPPLFTVK
jgi:Asp-tRNA(Asn)/Glu-tRNA(Gln) amidotransferase A subunit family amidase